MDETQTPRKISPSKLMGTTSSALGQVGLGGESKVGKLSRILRTTRVQVNENTNDIKINVDKLMNVEDEQEQIQETIFNVVDKQGDTQVQVKENSNKIASGMDTIAKNLNIIAMELAGTNAILTNQLKNQEKLASELAQESRKEDRDKKEKESESVVKKVSENIVESVKTPFKSFFDRVIDFFKNIVLGTAVIGLLNWLKDPKNQQRIENFANFIIDKIPLILTGITAFLAIGLGVKIFGVLSAIGGAIKGLTLALGSGGLLGTLGLLAAGLGGIALTLFGMKAGVDNIVRPAVLGTDKEMADYKLETIRMARAAGINEKTGEPGSINSRGRFVPSGKPRTPEQEKVWEEVQKRDKFFESEKTRRKDIESRRETDLQSARESSAAIISDIKENNTTQTSRGTKLSDEGKSMIREEKARLAGQERSINEQYDQERDNLPQAQVSGGETGSTLGSSSWQDSMFGGDAAEGLDIGKITDSNTDMAFGGTETPKIQIPGIAGQDQITPIKSDPSMFSGSKDAFYSISAPRMGNETIVLPPTGGEESGSDAGGYSSSARNDAPSFSPFDVNNPTLQPVLATLNALV